MDWFNAARKGKVEELTSQLEAGQEVDAKDGKGRTALLLAAEKGHAAAVRLLLARGADANVNAKGVGRPLEVAVGDGHWDVAAALVEAGADPNAGGVAWFVIDNGRDDLLKLMLDRGLKPEGRHRDLGTYLEHAVVTACVKDGGRGKGKADPKARKEARCMELLLAAGADVRRFEDAEGGSLLFHACYEADEAMVRRLAQLGADVNGPVEAEERKTLLMWCAETGAPAKMVRLLVELGADLERKDRHERTALNLAEEEGNRSIAKLLRELGAKENQAKDRDEVDDDEDDEDVDPVAAPPFPQRRGTLQAWDYNDWQTVGVYAGGPGGIDEVCDKLAKVKKVGVVERDVTRDALAGALPAPDAPHVLFLKMKGHAWALAAASWIGRLSSDDLAEQLSREAGLRTILCGHGDTASATFFRLREGDKPVVDFESCGEGFGGDEDGDDEEEIPKQWISKRYPKAWWRKHADENEALQALVRDQDAYLPTFDFSTEKGKLGAYAYPEDTLDPANVERVALIVYGPASAARPNPAGRQLADAIKKGDPAAVRTAIRAGASLKFLPEINGTALSYAVGKAENTSPERIEVIRALLEAGADPNDGGTSGPPIFEPFDSVGWETHEALPVLEALLDGGADIGARSQDLLYRGQTPLHIAAAGGKLAIVKFLHARGADVRATDPEGHTPLAKAESALKFTRENFEEVGANHSESLRAVIDYLKRAESGAAAEDDWDELAGKDKAREERRRRELTKSFADLGAVLKQFGAVMDAKSKKGAAHAAADLATLTQPDKIKVRQIADDLPWGSPKTRDKAAKALRERGFEPFGTFAIEQFPGCRMAVLLHPRQHTYAAVCEMGDQRWVDLVRYYTDGSALTVTNAKTHEAAQVDVPKLRKIREPKSDVAGLVDRLFAEPPPAGARVQEVTAAEFTMRFERHYAQEMRYRKKQSRAKA